MHLRHCQKLGVRKYFDLGQDIVKGTITRERYVFDKVIEHFKYLNQTELIHAETYMNRYYKTFGIIDEVGNPKVVDISFDISGIPTKRQNNKY
jgi:hypothetical protein